MSSANVLIIEDETKLARFVELELKYEGYSVDIARDGREGLAMFDGGEYDLVLLDLMLPGLNGLEILRKIRKASDVPVIMLTAKDEVMDKVVGLDTGADDYVTKPFAIEEVLARMRTALKRGARKDGPESLLRYQSLAMDVNKREVRWGETEIDLTKTEFDLLAYLLSNRNIALTREQILNRVWGYDYYGETNVVDVYVRYLRSKLDDCFQVKIIHTVRGIGYCVKDEGHEDRV